MILSSACCTALARHVARDRRVVGFAADLVDLVDIDDAALRPLDIVVGVLQQLEDDVLDVLANIARFGQRRGVAMVKGTSRMRASVWASSVLPQPVGRSAGCSTSQAPPRRLFRRG
jgi:hypothetical protein